MNLITFYLNILLLTMCCTCLGTRICALCRWVQFPKRPKEEDRTSWFIVNFLVSKSTSHILTIVSIILLNALDKSSEQCYLCAFFEPLHHVLHTVLDGSFYSLVCFQWVLFKAWDGTAVPRQDCHVLSPSTFWDSPGDLQYLEHTSMIFGHKNKWVSQRPVFFSPCRAKTNFLALWFCLISWFMW